MVVYVIRRINQGNHRSSAGSYFKEGFMSEEQVRCLNCFERIKVSYKTERLTCPKCGEKYVIAWLGSQPKIQGMDRN